MRDPAGPRSFGARAGITALNLVLPGLGLLRVGKWQSAVLFLVAPFVLAGSITFGFGHLPITSYVNVLFALVLIAASMAALYIIPAVLTWRGSRLRLPIHWWARWYGLAAIALAVLGLLQVMPPLMHRFYKPYYAPSSSMAPTIAAGDKFVVDMRWRGPLRRGQIVVFTAADGARVSRIAAVAGDRIGMRAGVPVVNGTTVRQQHGETMTLRDAEGQYGAAVLTERLPGETVAHRVLDVGPSIFDEKDEVVVPSGHVFVLGDNRDRSADSRVAPAQSGVGMVPIDAIVGRPMYIHWSSDRAKIGYRFDR